MSDEGGAHALYLGSLSLFPLTHDVSSGGLGAWAFLPLLHEVMHDHRAMEATAHSWLLYFPPSAVGNSVKKSDNKHYTIEAQIAQPHTRRTDPCTLACWQRAQLLSPAPATACWRSSTGPVSSRSEQRRICRHASGADQSGIEQDPTTMSHPHQSKKVTSDVRQPTHLQLRHVPVLDLGVRRIIRPRKVDPLD